MSAAKKQKSPRNRARSFAAFVDEVRGGFADMRADMRARFEHVEDRFKRFDTSLADLREHMNQRFDQVDRRFAQVDVRFDRIEGDIGRIQQDVVHIQEDIGLLKDAAHTHSGQLKELQATVARKVNREEVSSP